MSHSSTAHYTPKDHSATRCLLLGILILAAGLRWYAPGFVDYSYDEASQISMVKDVAAFKGEYPLLSGSTSIGFQRSALSIYLFAIPYLLFSHSIEAIVIFLGMLNVVAIAFVYVLGKRIGGYLSAPNRGEFVGLAAAFYSGLNPWLVLYDRKLWAHIHLLLSVLILLLAWHVVVHKQRQAAFWLPIVAALQLSSHLLALVQALSWLGGLLSAPRRWCSRAFGFGIGCAALILLPYGWALYGYAQRTGQVASELIGRATARSIDPWWSFLDQPQTAWHLLINSGLWQQVSWILTGAEIERIVQLEMSDSRLWFMSHWFMNQTVLKSTVLLLIGLGVARTIFILVKRDRTSRGQIARGQMARGSARLLLLWTVGPVLLLGLELANVYPQYWTVLLPLPALYFALGLWVLVSTVERVVGRVVARVVDRVANHRINRIVNRTAKSVAAGAVMGLIAVFWLSGYTSVLGSIAHGRNNMVPLRNWQAAFSVVHEVAKNDDLQEVRVAVKGVDPGYSIEPAVVASLIENPPYARFVAPSSPPAILLSAERPSLYFWAIDEPATETLLADLGREIWTGQLTSLRTPAHIYRLPPASELDVLYTRLKDGPVFDVGMQLVGYRFLKQQNASEVLIVWRVLDPDADVRARDFTAFNHVLDADGKMVGQVDGLALLSRDWWPGDVLLQPYVIDLPTGKFRWRVGLYSRVDGARSITSLGTDYVDLEMVVE